MMTILRGALCALLLAQPAQALTAEETIELAWEQLIPPEARTPDASGDTPWGVVQHGLLDLPPDGDEGATALVTDYNGKRVRLPGFVVPLDFDKAEATEFLLVPYVGACIHVPPPPPNQIVYVQSEKAVAMEGMFEPVWVTGVFASTTLSTELADVGYRITADAVAPYEQ